jgi:hypothetical protein
MLSASAENISGPLKTGNPRLRGDEISFDVAIGSSPYRFTGKVSGGKIAGSALTPGNKQPIPWHGTKLPAQTK